MLFCAIWWERFFTSYMDAVRYDALSWYDGVFSGFKWKFKPIGLKLMCSFFFEGFQHRQISHQKFQLIFFPTNQHVHKRTISKCHKNDLQFSPIHIPIKLSINTENSVTEICFIYEEISNRQLELLMFSIGISLISHT